MSSHICMRGCRVFSALVSVNASHLGRKAASLHQGKRSANCGSARKPWVRIRVNHNPINTYTVCINLSSFSYICNLPPCPRHLRFLLFSSHCWVGGAKMALLILKATDLLRLYQMQIPASLVTYILILEFHLQKLKNIYIGWSVTIMNCSASCVIC